MKSEQLKAVAGLFGQLIAANGTTFEEFERNQSDGAKIGEAIAEQLKVIADSSNPLPSADEYMLSAGWHKPADKRPEEWDTVAIITSDMKKQPPLPALYTGDGQFQIINGMDLTPQVLYWCPMPSNPITAPGVCRDDE